MKELKSFYGNGLNYDNINFSDYFRTLSFEGKRQSMIGEEKFNSLKNGIGELLSRTINEYTGYESTSVMRETANDIFISILYCLDMALFSYNSHEQALEYMAESDVNEIYVQGQKIIKQCVFECISMLVKLKSRRINFADKSYDTLLENEVKAYLKKYDSKYFAHSTKRVFSYNSVNGCGAYRGILCLKKMLENLLFESDFVNSFGEDVVQNICYGYCENNNLEYNDIGKNIYSIIFTNRLFAIMSGNNGLEVSKEDALNISRQLKRLNEHEQRRIIYSAAESISGESYIKVSAIKLAGHIINAVEDNCLNRVMYIGEIK